MALNMGQLLSIPFIVAGAAMIWYGLTHKRIPEQVNKVIDKPKKTKR
jgi:prolipoprotein diacylglyceryltransferase